MGRITLNAFVGFVVGIASGLIGLGGAELRLPYLIGTLRLAPHQAVRVNLAVSLFTIVAAIPARLVSLPSMHLAAFLPETLAIAGGAIVSAYLGAAWLRRLSAATLSRTIAGLLVILGIGILIEAGLGMNAVGVLPGDVLARIAAGILFGVLIGAISSVLGVAGGEVIIPTLVFAYGVPIKAAGSLSMVISLPTVVSGLVRHVRSGFLQDRAVLVYLILPMGVGSAAGATVGGLIIGIAPVGALKIGLGFLLVWSAWKVLTAHRPIAALAAV